MRGAASVDAERIQNALHDARGEIDRLRNDLSRSGTVAVSPRSAAATCDACRLGPPLAEVPSTSPAEPVAASMTYPVVTNLGTLLNLLV